MKHIVEMTIITTERRYYEIHGDTEEMARRQFNRTGNFMKMTLNFCGREKTDRVYLYSDH